MGNILNIKDVAKMLGVSEKTLRRWDGGGKLKAHRDKNNWRYYKKEDILEFVRENEKYKTFESVKNHKKFKELNKKTIYSKDDFDKFTKYDYEYICKSINGGKTDYDEMITKDFYAELFFSIYDLDNIRIIEDIIERKFIDNADVFIKNYKITLAMSNLLKDTIFFIGLFDIPPREIDKFANRLKTVIFYNNTLSYDEVYDLIYGGSPDLPKNIKDIVEKLYGKIKEIRRTKESKKELVFTIESPKYAEELLFINVLFY